MQNSKISLNFCMSLLSWFFFKNACIKWSNISKCYHKAYVDIFSYTLSVTEVINLQFALLTNAFSHRMKSDNLFKVLHFKSAFEIKKLVLFCFLPEYNNNNNNNVGHFWLLDTLPRTSNFLFRQSVVARNCLLQHTLFISKNIIIQVLYWK